MDPELARKLRALLESQRVGALGTLRAGAPYVSMVPFAMVGVDFVVHVSTLAAHTKDMLEDSRVSLLVMAIPTAEVPPQALPRVTVQADAARIDAASAEYARAKDAYLSRFPDSAVTFELADFSLFALRPLMLRYVGGFAQAKSITAEGLAEALRGLS